MTEIKIVAFNPTADDNHFVADVYIDGNRVYCGTGIAPQSKDKAIDNALSALDDLRKGRIQPN